MADGLQKITEVNLDGTSVSSFDVGGSNWDSSYNVYLVVLRDISVNSDNRIITFRVLDTSNNEVTSSLYNWGRKIFYANQSFGNGSLENTSIDYLSNNRIGTAVNKRINAVFTLFNFNNTSEYSFYTTEQLNMRHSDNQLQGMYGGGIIKQAAAHKGFKFTVDSGSIIRGTAILYGYKV